MKGCEAMAEAAVRAGCRFFAGYPITPQNEIPEYMSRRLPEVGGHFVQGESEVASVNMVYGAASAGTRAMTSSSSPGIALKSEGISYCAAARIPIVYINVARGGPGVGSIQPAQMDYMQATKASGNGGFEMRVFAPSTVQEAVDFTYRAFDLADQDRNPVLILAEGMARIDNRKYKDRFGCKAVMISGDDVERLVGHGVGGVCPFGVNEGVTVYLDESLKQHETVYPAAGSDHSAVRLSIAELEYCCNGPEWVDICKMPDGQ